MTSWPDSIAGYHRHGYTKLLFAPAFLHLSIPLLLFSLLFPLTSLLFTPLPLLFTPLLNSSRLLPTPSSSLEVDPPGYLQDVLVGEWTVRVEVVAAGPLHPPDQLTHVGGEAVLGGGACQASAPTRKVISC